MTRSRLERELEPYMGVAHQSHTKGDGCATWPMGHWL